MTTFKSAITHQHMEAVAKHLKKAAVLLLFTPLALFQSCESEVDGPTTPEGQQPPTSSYTVKIGSSNENLPGPGTLTLEFADFLSGGDLNRAVDNNPTTKLITPHSKFYILWKGDKEFLMNNYHLTAADAPQCDPKSWLLVASNDGTTWTELDSQTNQTFSDREETKRFTLSENTTAYIYYKLEIKSNNGASNTQIAEWAIGYESKVPETTSITVTSNNSMPGAGTLSVPFADAPSANGLNKIIDGMKSTSFITYHSNYDITWVGNKATKVTIYSLMSSVNNAENDPKSWTLSGSNDATAWTTLHTESDYKFTTRKEKKWFRVDNKTSYTHYKLTIKANNGGTFTEIAEMQLLNIDMDITSILDKAKAQTSENALTEMGHFFTFRKDQPTTEAERAWLNDPTKEPLGKYKEDTAENPYPPLHNFKVELYPFGKPMMADANQRGVGDCCAIAAFASLAYCYPEFIQSIITDNGNDTYTVKMFDPNRERIDVTVSNKFWAANAGYLNACAGKGAAQATWATVFEKALMKYHEIYYNNPNLGGIATPRVAPPFTGCGYGYAYNFNSAKLTPTDWHRLVKISLITGQYMVGGFWVAGIPLGGGVSLTAHAFSYMHSADHTALFAMRNPWGNGDADGLLTMPFDNTVLTSQADIWIFDPGTEVSKFKMGILDGYSYPYDL